jgi:uncharacterized protein
VLDVRERGGAIQVAARVRPRSRPGLELTDSGLVIRVAAVPEKGRATEEARRLLASALGVAPSGVELRSGAAARRKTFLVAGLSATEARSRLLAAAG